MLRRPSPLLALLLAAACAAPSAPSPATRAPTARPAPEGRVDVEHYRIELVLSPAERRVDARCTVRLRALERASTDVELDFEGLEVTSVTDGRGRELRHRHDAGWLRIALPEPVDPADPVELVVAYSGTPAKGLWFSGERLGRSTQAFTQGECEDARWWFPCHDDPADRATFETIVTLPAEWKSVAAGELVDSTVDARGATRRDHWRMNVPSPPYLVTLAAGELALFEGDWDGVPLSYLAPPEWAEVVEPSLAATPRALAFLSEVTGERYPYPKYAQTCVEGFPFGGMENVSATTLTVTALREELERPDGSAQGLVVHEAAHQWFGDWLTCGDWSHVWLNEGFASYMTMLYVERFEGADAFRVQVRDAREAYVRGDRDEPRAIVHGECRDPIDLFSGGHVYAGGASRLHLLRFVLGDEVFFRGLRRYVGRHGGGSVVTDDLRLALEEVSGTDLRPFFEQWLLSPGHPEFEVRWRWDASQSRVLLTVDQVQEIVDGTPGVFRTPVLIELAGSSGRELLRQEISKRRELFSLPFPERPDWVRFDKYGWIPCSIDSSKPLTEWSAIAVRDDDVNGRLDALRALGRRIGSEEESERGSILTVLADRAGSDTVARVRAVACEELGRAGGREARRALEAAARTDEDAEVRVAALRALTRFAPDSELRSFGEEIWAGRFSAATMGAAAGLVAAAGTPGGADWIIERLDSEPPRGPLAKELLRVLGTLDDPRAESILLRWAGDADVPEDTRAQAVEALGQREPRSRTVRRALVELLDAPVWRVRYAAVQALAEGREPADREALTEHHRRSVFPRERRVIERALGDGSLAPES